MQSGSFLITQSPTVMKEDGQDGPEYLAPSASHHPPITAHGPKHNKDIPSLSGSIKELGPRMEGDTTGRRSHTNASMSSRRTGRRGNPVFTPRSLIFQESKRQSDRYARNLQTQGINRQLQNSSFMKHAGSENGRASTKGYGYGSGPTSPLASMSTRNSTLIHGSRQVTRSVDTEGRPLREECERRG